MTEKVDFRKTMKVFYNPKPGGFHVVNVPRLYYLMIDGQGDPNVASEYQQALEGLYALSYRIKFASKSPQRDYVVPPLEGLWWMENMAEFTLANKPRWKWTMMIMQPEWITSELIARAKEEAYRKKKITSLMDIVFEPYQEGLSVQILYYGAYSEEGPIIAQMHQYIHDHGYVPNGKHHEIYLSDPRKTAAGKLKTILRQPVQKA